MTASTVVAAITLDNGAIAATAATKAATVVRRLTVAFAMGVSRFTRSSGRLLNPPRLIAVARNSDANPIDEVKLCFEEVDMSFLVFQQGFKNLHRYVVFGPTADFARVGVKCLRVLLASQIALDCLFEVLPDPQRRNGLQIWVSIEKDDPIDRFVR
jgi:hypothetical protein